MLVARQDDDDKDDQPPTRWWLMRVRVSHVCWNKAAVLSEAWMVRNHCSAILLSATWFKVLDQLENRNIFLNMSYHQRSSCSIVKDKILLYLILFNFILKSSLFLYNNLKREKELG